MGVDRYITATSAAALLCAIGGAALAQTVSSGAAASDAQATAVAAGIGVGPNPASGMIIGDWLLYPSLFTGVVYTDNVYNQSMNRQSGIGIRLRPALEAVRDGGIHSSSAYARADAQFYPGRAQAYQFFPNYSVLTPPSNVTANVGFSHDYKPMPDLKFTVLSDYTRGGGGIFGGGVGMGGSGAIPSAVSLVSVGTYSNQFTGGVAVEKLIGNGFARVASTVQHVFYDAPASNLWLGSLYASTPLGSALGGGYSLSAKGPSATNFTGGVRVGYWVTPQFYAFVEPSADLRRSSNWRNDTNGYRVTAGLGSDLISLFRGEIYAGYMSQASSHGLFGAKGSPAFGARLSYYPTRQLTLSVSVDQSLTAPVVQASSPSGAWISYAPTAPTRTVQAKVQADYQILDYWGAYARLGWGQSRSGGYYNYASGNVGPTGGYMPGWQSGISTDVWGAGAGMSYTFWRNVALTLDYSFSRSVAHNPNYILTWAPTGVTSNVVSAGLTYKY